MDMKITCPRCGKRIEDFDSFDIQRIYKDFVEVEMFCDSCERVVAFYRIHSKDWVERSEGNSDMKGRLRKMTLNEVLSRISGGKSDATDAAQVQKWLFGDRRGNIVNAYLTLIGNVSDARRYLTKELRDSLAKALAGDGN